MVSMLKIVARGMLNNACLAALLLMCLGTAWTQALPRDWAESRAESEVRNDAISALKRRSSELAQTSSVPTKDPAGIFDGGGNFDVTAYINVAKAYGTAAMIPERFGSPWSAFHESIAAPTWSKA